MSIRNTLAGVAILAGLCASSSSSKAAVVFADFESESLTGFGQLTSGSGVQPWASPVAGAVVTATSSSLTGSKVLNLTGDPSFNFGQASGAALGINLLALNMRSAFLANSRIEFDWVAVPNSSPSGFSQLFNIILNSQGGGFTTVGGSSASTPNTNQFYFTGYNGNTLHVVLDYTTYKNTVLASANPDAGGWLEFAIQPNAGGGAPGSMYFDNFQFTAVPEPAGMALLAISGVALLNRRRRC